MERQDGKTAWQLLAIIGLKHYIVENGKQTQK